MMQNYQSQFSTSDLAPPHSFHGDSQFAHQRGQVLPSFTGGVVRVVDVRVEFHRDPPIVASALNRGQRRPEVDRAVAGDQMFVDTSRRNIFEVIVLRVR